MSQLKFNLIVAGEIVAGAAPEAVKMNLAKLFKLPLEKAEVLLAKTPRIIQKNVDQATAIKWRAALQSAGLKSTLEAVQATEPIGISTNERAAASNNPPVESVDNKNITMVGTIRTGGDEFTGPFEVAKVGADLGDRKEELPALIPSIEHLSLAPVGADIETLQEAKEVVNPDISHLTYS